tara:strand:+ start:418 stop:1254 length:837 start_codon:yes stop_codon:yes gene_type:complete
MAKAIVKTSELDVQELDTTQVVQNKVSKPKEIKVPEWEIKDRTYFLKNMGNPLTLTIPSRHTSKHALLYFDEITNEQKEIRYATNQNSAFMDEQKGQATLGHITFTNGALIVPKAKQNLQKILSLYHPLKNNIYTEFDKVEVATDQLDELELQIDALNAAMTMEVDQAEAIMRVEIGSKVSDMSSKELKRDLLLFARKSPLLFLELANDDNVQLRNFAIRATEARIIKLSQDQRTFMWGTNDRKLMTVPFDENPYSAMAAFFKTDEGVEIYRTIEKKL